MMKKGNVTILASIIVIATMMFSMGLGTMAYFTDTKTSPGSTFTAGTLKLDGVGFASFDLGTIVTNMAPGDLSSEASITIKNTGNLPLAWFGDWVITGGVKLREAIYIDSATMRFYAIDGINTWEPTDNFITNGVGSGPYPGWYNTLAALSHFGVVSLDVWDGNNGMGTTPYEHMGALKPGYSYRLTVRFGFAKNAGNEYQGDITNPVTISFKVDATQINAGALEALHPTFSNHLIWLQQQIAKQP